MSDLRRLLSQADRIPAPDLWPDIRARRPRRSSVVRRQLVAGAVALALAASVIALVSTAFLGGRALPPIPRGAAGVAVDPRITAEVQVGDFPQEIAVGEGAVWVTVNDAGSPDHWFVARIDPIANRVTDEIDLPDAVDVALGSGSVWAITHERATGWAVARIDPTIREVTHTIPLDCHRRCSATQIATTEDAVWVTSALDYPERGEVIRIDPATNQVAARTAVAGDPRDIAIGEGGVWVYALTHFARGGVAGGTLYRIDPLTDLVSVALLEGQIPPVAGISGPPVLTVGHGYVWTIRQVGQGPDEELVRIDPRTNQVEGVGISGTFHPFAVGEGGVWLRASRGPSGSVLPVAIARLNTETLKIDESVDMDELPVDAVLDATFGVIWVAAYEGPVIRIDLR